MFRSKGNSGYGLIMLIVLLLAVAGSALGVRIYQQGKMHALQDELIVETLHQARMAIMRYYQNNGSWPLPPFAASIEDYVESIELIAGSTSALRVRLFNKERVERIQPYLAASWISGDTLWLRLATEPASQRTDDADANPAWVRREGEAIATMNTHLDMTNARVLDIGRLQAENTHFNQLTSTQLLAQQTEGTSLDAAYTVSENLSANAAVSSRLVSTSIVNTQGSAELLQITGVGNIGDWQQQQINMQAGSVENAAFGQAAAANVVAANLQAQSLNAAAIASQALTSEYATIANVTANVGNVAATQIENANTQNLIANNIMSGQANTRDITVSSAVELKGFHAEALDALRSELDILYLNLYNCIYENRWCEEPKPPTIALQSCIGCNREQSEEQFVADIGVTGGECVHGCEFELILSGANGSCNPSVVRELNNGNTTCTIEKSLAPGESWQQMVRVRAKNRKNQNVRSELSAFVNWQRTVANCPSFMVQEPIYGTEPMIFTTLVFADTQAGNTATVNKSGIGCANWGSEWHCNGSAQCSASGEWQNVQTYCGCGF